ncbi:MAG: arginine--tRNA ligase, partial [Terriglobales bacterium]
MYFTLEQRLKTALREHLRHAYTVDLADLVVESPPRSELGEFALPVCFELARQLRRPPRQIAQEIAQALALPPGFERVEAAGGGYLNFYVQRAAAWDAATANRTELQPRFSQPAHPKVIVEHTNINPNKAAHIGHLRNAVLGDTWVRLLRHRGEAVEVQNLLDNTGVQVADVVIAFLRDSTPEAAQRAVAAALSNPAQPFDSLCWDKYADISQLPEVLAAQRPETLRLIEAGANPVAELAELIASNIVRAHLRTMERLHIRYDVLPRESEILHLHFWDQAFELLKAKQVARLETTGANAGCWVMDWAPDDASPAPTSEAQPEAAAVNDVKVLVRSTGTVTYVAKDIGYQMWKFGLLPLEFGYRRFHQYSDGHQIWTTALRPDPDAPAFGHGDWVFNVIDVRQSYLQDIVTFALRVLGYQRQAEHSVHFSYEMVALTPACAAELGYATAGEKRVDVSGRKGTGVKADDLIDRMEANTRAEVEKRHPEMAAEEQHLAAHQIAVCALRYFLLKYTRTTLIAFDFKEALSFEGETGPYVQYAAVRAGTILRKAGLDADAAVAAASAWAAAPH